MGPLVLLAMFSGENRFASELKYFSSFPCSFKQTCDSKHFPFHCLHFKENQSITAQKGIQIGSSGNKRYMPVSGAMDLPYDASFAIKEIQQ